MDWIRCPFVKERLRCLGGATECVEDVSSEVKETISISDVVEFAVVVVCVFAVVVCRMSFVWRISFSIWSTVIGRSYRRIVRGERGILDGRRRHRPLYC